MICLPQNHPNVGEYTSSMECLGYASEYIILRCVALFFFYLPVFNASSYQSKYVDAFMRSPFATVSAGPLFLPVDVVWVCGTLKGGNCITMMGCSPTQVMSMSDTIAVSFKACLNSLPSFKAPSKRVVEPSFSGLDELLQQKHASACSQ